MKSVLAVNLALVTLVIWGFAGEFTRDRALQQEIAALDAQASALREGNLELAELREKFAGAGELEREARLKLNLQKPGEEVVVIQGEIASRTAVAASGGETAPDAPSDGSGAMGNVQRWWRFFFQQH